MYVVLTRGSFSTTCNILVRPRGCLIYRVIIFSLQISIPDLCFSHLSFFFYLVIYKFPSWFLYFLIIYFFHNLFNTKRVSFSSLLYYNVHESSIWKWVQKLFWMQYKWNICFSIFFYKHDWLNLIDYLTHSSLIMVQEFVYTVQRF